FFFSSRRRHTRSYGDWSSDVCSSDLWAADDLPQQLNFDRYKGMLAHSPFAVASAVVAPAATPNFAKDLYVANAAKAPDCDMVTRSEERRVGKECRYRWSREEREEK